MVKKIAAPAVQVTPITCPACKSKISFDGSTLKERSEYLDGLIETDAGVDELEKTIGVLEKKLLDAKAETASVREEMGKKEAVKNVATQPEGAKAGRASGWW